MFKDKHCLISNPVGLEIFTIKMKGKSFSLDWMEEESAAFLSTANQTELWHKRCRGGPSDATSFDDGGGSCRASWCEVLCVRNDFWI